MVRDAPVVARFAGREFFARDTVAVARELVGAELVVDGGEVVVQIVEVEAYLGELDPASHAWRGPTPRSRIMFGEAGHLYVYISYGMHHCANVVTEASGVAGAVLLRAAVVTHGEAIVRARRRNGDAMPSSRLLSGPGNLCRGLGIDLADNGADLAGGSAGRRVALRPASHEVPQLAGPRVGISRNADAPLRFRWKGHAAVSRG